MSDLTTSAQAVTAKATPDLSVSTGFDVAALHGPHSIAVAEGSDDHVMRSLSWALEAAEQGQDRYCAEALRFAIAVRWAGLQSDMRSLEPDRDAAPTGRPARALQKWRLRRVIDYVDTHLSNKIGLVDLAAVAGLSRMHFASQFRAATGLRPHEFLLRRRIRRAEELLRHSTMTIVEIALTVGFQTQAHFTTVFKKFIGCPPRHWRVANQMPSVRTFMRADVTTTL